MRAHAYDTKWQFGTLAVAALAGIVLAVAILAGFLGEGASAVRLPAVADEMSAFKDPPLESEEVPEVVRRAEEHLGQAGHGAVIPGQVRRLAGGLERNGVGVYAFPTSGGAICVVVSEETYAATCVDSFSRADANVRPLIYSGEGSPVAIAGLATDDVRSVQVVVNGLPQKAALRDNAFYWQSDEGVTRADVKGLRVRQTGGEVLTVNLDFGQVTIHSSKGD